MTDEVGEDAISAFTSYGGVRGANSYPGYGLTCCLHIRKWCQKRDRDVSPKRYITMLYCDFSNFDTVENTVLALALVLNEDSNRCGRSISDQSATPKFILRPADNFLPENGEKPNQAAPNEAAMAGAISAASCCTTAPLPTNRSTLAIRRRSSPSIMP